MPIFSTKSTGKSSRRRISGWALLTMVAMAFLGGWVLSPLLRWSALTYSFSVDPLADKLHPVPGEAVRLPADAYLDIKIQPDHRIDDPLAIQVYAGRPDGAVSLLPIHPTAGPYGGGVFFIHHPLSDLHLEPGLWNIYILIGRAGWIPSAKRMEELITQGQERGWFWHLLYRRIDIQPVSSTTH